MPRCYKIGGIQGTNIAQNALISKVLQGINPRIKKTINLAKRQVLPTFALLKTVNQMANHSATKKDARQAAKRRDRNKYYGKTTRNAIRDLKAADANGMKDQFPTVASMIDKLAKRGIIHKNKAANLKSKLARKANSTK